MRKKSKSIISGLMRNNMKNLIITYKGITFNDFDIYEVNMIENKKMR